MNDDKLVPELHDVGKLIDWKNIDKNIKGHNFEGVNWSNLHIQEPTNQTWKGIALHHNKKGNINIFILKLADQMASGISRAFLKDEKDEITESEDDNKKDSDQTVFKLWNQQQKEIGLFSSKEDITKIIEFIKTVNNGQVYLEDEFFHAKLLARPEDFKPPLNITSLYIHSKLVGKLYYFFESKITEKEGLLYFAANLHISPYPEKNYDIKRNMYHVRKNWHLKLIYGKIELMTYPSRVRDLNVFEILKEESKKISQENNVIFQTSDQFLAYIPVEESIDGLITNFLDRGFKIHVEEAQTEFYEAYPTPRAIAARLISQNNPNSSNTKFSTYIKIKKPEPLIKKPICEICQFAPASEPPWVDEELVENICDTCRDIRTFGESPAPKLQNWYLNEPLSKVAWIKIYLHINFLNEILKLLFINYSNKYLKYAEIINSDPTKYDLRFSVLAEFQHDYDRFLEEFNQKIVEKFNSDDIQPILNDFLCVKLDKISKIKDILEIYNNLFANYFPKLKDQKSPITLSISVSNVKFAFFRHWKILDNPTEDVNVALIGSGEMHLTLKQLETLIKDFKIPASKQLHKLAKISETSEKLAKVLVYDKGDFRVYSAFEPLRNLEKKIDFKTILTYTKILEDKNELP